MYSSFLSKPSEKMSSHSSSFFSRATDMETHPNMWHFTIRVFKFQALKSSDSRLSVAVGLTRTSQTAKWSETLMQEKHTINPALQQTLQEMKEMVISTNKTRMRKSREWESYLRVQSLISGGAGSWQEITLCLLKLRKPHRKAVKAEFRPTLEREHHREDDKLFPNVHGPCCCG